MSEHHYEEHVDEDAALKILNFGDDYRNFIDSLSEDEDDDDLSKEARRKARKRVRRVS